MQEKSLKSGYVAFLNEGFQGTTIRTLKPFVCFSLINVLKQTDSIIKVELSSFISEELVLKSHNRHSDESDNLMIHNRQKKTTQSVAVSSLVGKSVVGFIYQEVELFAKKITKFGEVFLKLLHLIEVNLPTNLDVLQIIRRRKENFRTGFHRVETQWIHYRRTLEVTNFIILRIEVLLDQVLWLLLVG